MSGEKEIGSELLGAYDSTNWCICTQQNTVQQGKRNTLQRHHIDGSQKKLMSCKTRKGKDSIHRESSRKGKFIYGDKCNNLLLMGVGDEQDEAWENPLGYWNILHIDLGEQILLIIRKVLTAWKGAWEKFLWWYKFPPLDLSCLRPIPLYI